MCALSIMYGYYTLDVYKTYGLTQPALDSDIYLTEVGSVGGLFGALRFIWSWALDHYSYRKVYGSLLVLQIILALTIKWTSLSRSSYAIAVCLCIWCEGGHFTLAPNIL